MKKKKVFLQSPSETRSKTATSMHSGILACERSAYPLLLHCLQDLEHDWSHLRLVNKNMCAAFMHYKIKVALHTAKRQRHLRKQAIDKAAKQASDKAGDLRYRQESRMICGLVDNFDTCDRDFFRGFRIFHPVDELREVWAEFERTVTFAGLLVRPVERPPPHMQLRIAAPGPLVRALEQRNEPRTVSYSSNILDTSPLNSFFRGSRTFDAAQFVAGAAVHTAVIEVD
jgi:hypothetical protein